MYLDMIMISSIKNDKVRGFSVLFVLLNKMDMRFVEAKPAR